MATKLIAFRLDLDLIKAIEREAEAKGWSKTDVVAIALRQAFGLSAQLPSSSVLPSETVSNQALQIVEVQQQVANLGETLSSLDSVIRGLTNRITSLEQQFDQVNSRSSQSEVPSNGLYNILLDKEDSKHQQLSIEDAIAELTEQQLYNTMSNTPLDVNSAGESLEEAIAQQFSL
jgi:hypothetical protein